jgi:hypothetical protein
MLVLLALSCAELDTLVNSAMQGQPYQWLHGGFFSPEQQTGSAYSPDPLLNFRWNQSTNSSALQVYTLHPVEVTSDEQGAFKGLQDLVVARSYPPQLTPLPQTSDVVTVSGAGSFRVDFGVESGGWLELLSDDLPAEVLSRLTLSISETTQPYKFRAAPNIADKVLQPVQVSPGLYRLQTLENPGLMEGVRFGFVVINRCEPSATVHCPTPEPVWHIRAIRVVCQTLPVNYKGSLASADAEISQVWYSGAYCPKLNMQPGFLGTELMNRGDRNEFAGDAYKTLSAVMVAFGEFEYVGNIIDSMVLTLRLIP